MKREMFKFIVILIMIPFLIVGCQESSTPDQQSSNNENAESSGETFDEIDIITEDGLTLSGRLFGFGKKGVILSHMFPSDQTSWNDFASDLTKKGYIILTFDFRGYGDSEGQKEPAKIDLDEKAAYEFMKDQGVEEIFLIGASMGGTAALKVAGTNDVKGVVSISSPRIFRGLSAEKEIASTQNPKLFIASEDDEKAAEDAQWFFENGIDPKEIEIFSGSDHGSDLLTGKDGKGVKKSITDFLEDNSQ